LANLDEVAVELGRVGVGADGLQPLHDVALLAGPVLGLAPSRVRTGPARLDRRAVVGLLGDRRLLGERAGDAGAERLCRRRTVRCGRCRRRRGRRALALRAVESRLARLSERRGRRGRDALALRAVERVGSALAGGRATVRGGRDGGRAEAAVLGVAQVASPVEGRLGRVRRRRRRTMRRDAGRRSRRLAHAGGRGRRSGARRLERRLLARARALALLRRLRHAARRALLRLVELHPDVVLGVERRRHALGRVLVESDDLGDRLRVRRLLLARDAGVLEELLPLFRQALRARRRCRASARALEGKRSALGEEEEADAQ